jgi:hypothetical protein
MRTGRRFCGRKLCAGIAVAEKLGSAASGAKALTEKNGFITALKALRHPKASFSANCCQQTFYQQTVRRFRVT